MSAVTARLIVDPYADVRHALYAEKIAIERRQWVQRQRDDARLAEIRTELHDLPPEQGDHW